jgi:uncharacterized membrane protein YdjX (TVP38/TMEM64 family)
MSEERRLVLLRIIIFIGVMGLSAFIFSIRDQAEGFAAYGYPGIFLATLLASATVLLPMPGLAIVFAMASVFNPVGVIIAAASGAALGELSGYLAGFSGQAVIERMDVYERILPWIDRYGILTILVLGAIPNPFFDLAGIAAGAAKIPLGRFLLACWGGQLIKMTAVAYTGVYSINWLFS